MKAKHWLIGAGAVAFVAFLAWGRSNSTLYYVPAGSMSPTIQVNDYIWANPAAYRNSDPKRGDIAMLDLKNSLTLPGTPHPNDTVLFVKRIVGVPGDKIEIVNGRLKLNGVWQKEPFAHWDGKYNYSLKVVGNKVYSRDIGGEWACKNVYTDDQSQLDKAASNPIPARKYLVLGDNRSNSNDSHVFGFVDRDWIKSRVAYRITPNPRSF